MIDEEVPDVAFVRDEGDVRLVALSGPTNDEVKEVLRAASCIVWASSTEPRYLSFTQADLTRIACRD